MIGGPSFACPVPVGRQERVQTAHGGGGRLSRDLVDRVFRPAFANSWLDRGHDGALLDLPPGRVALTTDSYVVDPLFFPGGDIGSLAVFGTVNDLAMCGARPLYLSAGFVLEEGLPLETLERVARSMGAAARTAGVRIVTGDTKVVDRGTGDGLFVNTAGVGVVAHPGPEIGPAAVRPGDAILLSGDLGRHGIAVMAVREGLEFETAIESDSAPLAEPVLDLLEAGVGVHCLRDLTRGGLASALVEIAATSGRDIRLTEAAIPIGDAVAGACELLGLDPLSVANEGRFVAFVEAADAERALTSLRRHAVSAGACAIGRVDGRGRGEVQLRTRLGPVRCVEMLSGEQLPRIC